MIPAWTMYGKKSIQEICSAETEKDIRPGSFRTGAFPCRNGSRQNDKLQFETPTEIPCLPL